MIDKNNFFIIITIKMKNHDKKIIYPFKFSLSACNFQPLCNSLEMNVKKTKLANTARNMNWSLKMNLADEK